jgi:hypothetical protein
LNIGHFINYTATKFGLALLVAAVAAAVVVVEQVWYLVQEIVEESEV